MLAKKRNARWNLSVKRPSKKAIDAARIEMESSINSCFLANCRPEDLPRLMKAVRLSLETAIKVAYNVDGLTGGSARKRRGKKSDAGKEEKEKPSHGVV